MSAIKRLFIAEKPSLGEAILKGLPTTSQKQRGFIRLGNGDVITWAAGHLYGNAPPESYYPADRKAAKYWSDTKDLLPFIPEKWIKLPNAGAKDQLAIIKGLLADCETVIHTGDPDAEGQLIIDEILQIAGNKKPVKRLLLASTDKVSVERALASMQPNENFNGLYNSAVVRERADWLVGMNMTRAATLASTGKGVVSIGRVQTPTLALVVARDREREAFKPKDYFVVKAKIRTAKGEAIVTWVPPENLPGLDPEGRLIDRRTADAVVARVTGKPGTISDIKIDDKKESPPLPLSLSELQKAAGKYKISAKGTLDAAQALYSDAKQSYPRTDCGYLPESQLGDAKQILKALSGRFGAIATNANPALRSRAWNDKKVSAHHAIVPTLECAGAPESGPQGQIFDIVARHYIAQFYPDHEYRTMAAMTTVGADKFKLNGRVSLKEGWREVFGKAGLEDKNDEQASLPLTMADKGSAIQVLSAEVVGMKTTPPKAYTDALLIDAMKNAHKFITDPVKRERLQEAKGIGTEATRANIIEELLSDKKQMLVREKNEIHSTPRGRALVDALKGTAFVDVGTTAEWEHQRDLVEQGKLAVKEFIAAQVEYVKQQTKKILGSRIEMPSIEYSGGGSKGTGSGKSAGFKSKSSSRARATP
jgi:DNA topoisomerase-3